jgi:hypothetical protein
MPFIWADLTRDQIEERASRTERPTVRRHVEIADLKHVRLRLNECANRERMPDPVCREELSQVSYRAASYRDQRVHHRAIRVSDEVPDPFRDLDRFLVPVGLQTSNAGVAQQCAAVLTPKRHLLDRVFVV